MSKDHLEFQIKKQIEEREIAPSRDLWSEIKLQNGSSPAKSRLNWYLIAACLVLTVSLGAVLFFSSEKISDVKPQIVNNLDNSTEENLVKPEKKDSPILVKNQEIQTETEKKILSEKKQNQAYPIAVEEKMAVLQTHQENKVEILPEVLPMQPTKIMASMDSAKVPAKKKRYVDPSTLLFSVEHKEVIEKTKDGSNVATIDLNIR